MPCLFFFRLVRSLVLGCLEINEPSLLVPRPLDPHHEKYMEFSFGTHHVHTPFILVYDPSAKQIVKSIGFHFEFSDGALLRVRHDVSISKFSARCYVAF